MDVVTVTPAEVLAAREAGSGALILDVRTEEEWSSHHIPGATLLPMHLLMSRMGELDPARETIVVCEHGVRSMNVARYLVSQGFEQIKNMAGGMSEWAGPVEADDL